MCSGFYLSLTYWVAIVVKRVGWSISLFSHHCQANGLQQQDPTQPKLRLHLLRLQLSNGHFPRHLETNALATP